MAGEGAISLYIGTWIKFLKIQGTVFSVFCNSRGRGGEWWIEGDKRRKVDGEKTCKNRAKTPCNSVFVFC